MTAHLRTLTIRLRNRLLPGLLIASALSWSAGLQADNNALQFAALFSHNVPLNQTGAGSYSVTAVVGGVETEFLLDTGASMLTISSSLFKKIREQSSVIKVRQVGARLASGQVEILDIYQVEHFSLGGGCELGPVEVAVLKRGGRNLLGMNVLQQAAPFAISLSPPSLGLSQCDLPASQISMRD